MGWVGLEVFSLRFLLVFVDSFWGKLLFVGGQVGGDFFTKNDGFFQKNVPFSKKVAKIHQKLKFMVIPHQNHQNPSNLTCFLGVKLRGNSHKTQKFP